MSDSALKMVLDDLKGLLKDGTITFPQYQAGMDQALERALAAEVVKEELITSVKCVKSVMTAPVMKELVPLLPSSKKVGEKAPSDNNNNINACNAGSVIGTSSGLAFTRK